MDWRITGLVEILGKASFSAGIETQWSGQILNKHFLCVEISTFFKKNPDTETDENENESTSSTDSKAQSSSHSKNQEDEKPEGSGAVSTEEQDSIVPMEEGKN